MKKFGLLMLVAIFAVSAFLVWFFVNIRPVSSGSTQVNFTVPKGSSAGEVGKLLFDKGLIRNSSVFKIYIQFSGKSSDIQVGDYKLAPSMNIFQIADILTSPAPLVRVTIPEGLRKEEVAQKFTLALEKDKSFTAALLLEFQNEEGYLFPDTYYLAREAAPKAILLSMKSNYEARTKGLKPNGDVELNASQLLTLASIIERETRNANERPVVAGIYFNRLKMGMPLQADATVQYAAASLVCQPLNECNWWKPVTSVDLQTDSPFNTYKNAGLPPSPIGNPGLSAIKAVYAPQKTEYLYYIHDNGGNIHYARTLDEHNKNVNRYLR